MPMSPYDATTVHHTYKYDNHHDGLNTMILNGSNKHFNPLPQNNIFL